MYFKTSTGPVRVNANAIEPSRFSEGVDTSNTIEQFGFGDDGKWSTTTWIAIVVVFLVLIAIVIGAGVYMYTRRKK